MLICMFRNDGRVSGQEQELFSPVLFIQILRKKLYSTDHKQGRLFTCLQTKNWAEPRCNEVQGLGKYACCSHRTLHLRLQIVGFKNFRSL